MPANNGRCESFAIWDFGAVKNFVVAFAFLGVLLGAITMGGPGEYADTMRAERGLLLPVPEGYCALSKEDGEGGRLFKKSRYEPATASVQAITYFAKCDQLSRWRKEQQPIENFGVYSAVRGEFAGSEVSREDFVDSMADYLAARDVPPLEEALALIQSGVSVVDLGLVHRDHQAAYSAMLLSGPESEGEIQIHLTAYSKSNEFQYVLHLSEPFVDESTIRDMVETQKDSIKYILNES